MKLYECPRDSKIKFVYENQEYIMDFKHIDGMYSLCYLDGKPVHLSASADVELVKETVNGI
jgi:hypothetical protein